MSRQRPGRLSEFRPVAASARIARWTSSKRFRVLIQHQEALRALGVRHAALFGSVARGEQTAQSDVDLLVELNPDLQIGLFEYAGVTNHIEELFAGRAHVADRDRLKPYLRESVINDAIYAF